MTDATPAALGYRWPAEWERHAATWLAWPHNPETWPGRIDGAISAVVAMVRALAPHEAVAILVDASEGLIEVLPRILGAAQLDESNGEPHGAVGTPPTGGPQPQQSPRPRA